MLVSARFFNRLMIKMTMRFKRCFPRENDAHQNVRSISGRQTFCIGWAPISNNSFFWPRQNSAPPNEQARPIRLTKRFPCSWGAKRGLLRKPASSLHAAAARLRAALQWAAAYSNYFRLILQPSLARGARAESARAKSARQCAAARARRGAAAKPRNSRPAPSARDAWQKTGPSTHPNRPMPRATARAISSAALSLGMVG